VTAPGGCEMRSAKLSAGPTLAGCTPVAPRVEDRGALRLNEERGVSLPARTAVS